MTTLWVLSAGPEACPVIRRAREMGLRVVASDWQPEAPGLSLADHGVVASVYDPEETLAAARRFAAAEGPPDGVLCAAADAPHTAARLITEFGLAGVGEAAAHLATDKLAMKRRLAEAGIAVPWFHEVRDAAHLEQLVRKEGRDLILKPVDSRGARGVVRLVGDLDLGWAYAISREQSPTHRVMVERFLTGPQISTESLIVDGTCSTPGFADRNYEHLARFAPFVVENGGELPSRLSPDVQQTTRACVADAARALGLESGVVKGDLVLHEGRPVVIELAARLSGGYLCSHHIPLSTGVDFVGAAIRHAVGERLLPEELAPRWERGVAQRFFFPEPGRVVRIQGAEAAARKRGVALLELRVRPGDRVEPIRNHPGRAGLVIACAEDRQDAVALATSVVEEVRIETAPEPRS